MAHNQEVLAWWRKERKLKKGNPKQLDQMTGKLPVGRKERLKMRWEKRFKGSK